MKDERDRGYREDLKKRTLHGNSRISFFHIIVLEISIFLGRGREWFCFLADTGLMSHVMDLVSLFTMAAKKLNHICGP